MTDIIESSAPVISERPYDLERARLPSHWPIALQRIFAARGIENEEQLNYSLTRLLRPHQLMGMEQAIARLVQAVTEQERVVIIGDFDADGATSSTLAVLAFKAMGLSVDYLVPNRFDYGYGLTPEIVTLAQTRYSPNLLITVDNGIASIDGVSAANVLGIDVVVTDHHLPADQVPKACAIVNPNQKGCTFASKHLAGVGVIFYVMSALRAALRTLNWFTNAGIAEPNMAEYLDIVALGTVADVVPLDDNNRILVSQGLARIKAGKARAGIYALLSVAGKDYHTITSTDLGFIIGPRLNAAGRLDDMSVGINCLLAETEAQARPLAVELDSLNQERRAIERSMQAEALKFLEQGIGDAMTSQPWGICLYEPSWHQGVIGILAGRIKERYHRPVIAFAQTSEHEIKGSARSIEGLHIRDALDRIATQYPHMLTKFGGHAMAAGLSLDTQYFEAFSEAFDNTVRDMLDARDLQAQWLTDGHLNSDTLNIDFAKTLANSGPWGQQFPEPLFVGEFRVIQQKVVGKHHLKFMLQTDTGEMIDAIMFNVDQALLDISYDQVELVYQLAINRFLGNESAQLMIRHLSER